MKFHTIWFLRWLDIRVCKQLKFSFSYVVTLRIQLRSFSNLIKYAYLWWNTNHFSHRWQLSFFNGVISWATSHPDRTTDVESQDFANPDTNISFKHLVILTVRFFSISISTRFGVLPRFLAAEQDNILCQRHKCSKSLRASTIFLKLFGLSNFALMNVAYLGKFVKTADYLSLVHRIKQNSSHN